MSVALAGMRWEVLDAIASLQDERAGEARRILDDLRAAGRVDEFQSRLTDALRGTETAAVRLAARRPEPAPNADRGPRCDGHGHRGPATVRR